MLGLKRGAVQLCQHETAWELEAQKTISRLHGILGIAAKDIQHVGSTSIIGIKAKPIIDIAVAVDDFHDVLVLEQELKENGFYYRPSRLKGQLLFACGSYYDGSGNLQTHFVHVVLKDSMEWINYINFRDYLNQRPAVAKEYETLKLSLANTVPRNDGREKYTEGKRDFIARTLRKALAYSYLGKKVEIKIDRPMGSSHPVYKDTIYQVNYGYIPDVLGGDDKELDVYLLGVEKPVTEYLVHIIAVIHRYDDVEDKLVAAPLGMNFVCAEIADAVAFVEQYYDSEIEMFIEEEQR